MIFLLAGCASNEVPFQKLSAGIGYSLEEKGQPDNFIVKMELPKNIDSKILNSYAARAIGEECLVRGFAFFDFTDVVTSSSEGFCFKENKRKSLAISFEQKAMAMNPPEFLIANLNQKSQTNLQVGDKILRVDGKDMVSVSNLKSLIFFYGKQQNDKVQLDVQRDGKNFSVKEPIADLTGGAFGPEDLKDLRQRFF